MTSQETPREQHPEHKQRLPWIIGALMLAMLMSSLGQMIFSTALPTIVGELGGVNHMTWVITGFLLGQTIALPIFGKLGDQIGRKGLFLFANALFVLGSLLGGLAQSMSVLIVARVLQGIAGGGMMILSQAITAEVTTPRERGKYMGVMGSVFGISAVLGPILGGWFTDGVGWRWGLWLNVPMGLLAIVAIFFLLQLPPKPKRLRFDWLGMVTMSIATAALVLFVTWGGNEYAWDSPMILSLIATAVVIGALFIFVENRAHDPLVPLGLFKNRNFVLTTTAGFGIGIFMFGSLAYLPTYLQMVHGMSPTRAGLMLLCMMVGLMGTSIIVGNLVSAFGRYKAFPIAGLLIVSVAMTLLSTLEADTSLVIIGLYMFLFGFGMGCSMQILVLIVQNSFPVAMVGTVTATNNFFRQIGGSVGSALVGGLFVGNLTTQLQRNLPGADSLSGDNTAHLTPGTLSTLPEPLRQAIEVSYNDALTPIFLLLMPLAVLCSAVLIWVKEDKLKETIS
ncbi:MDR family MFS transporter [Corynebacterium oculi]|uniref:Multidrug resistance protein 3 n=1 Tax=Corynebacterium oculi TaxID=1544416 RepID=A0A0Q0TXE4_9CORY|nr:MDR family MFS transporter [Corynebacterium oculi]KQB83669.1 Multidrug resistance protein 3 [Corynebacterium oculi]